MIDSQKLKLFYSLSLLYLALGCVALITENFLFALTPFILLVVYLSIYAIDTLMLIIVFCTPLAIILQNHSFGFAVSLPTEPLLFGLLILFVFKVIKDGGFDRKVMQHPVTIAILIYLAWMFVTTLTSSMPLVSFKFLLAKLWFIVVFYFLGTQLFKNKANIKRFIWLYAIPLLIVIGYTIVRHGQNGWTQESAHWVMTPFYNDHTAYAAIIALFLPIMLAFSRNTLYQLKYRLSAWFVFIIMVVAMVLSYTRAAWISLFIAAGIYFIFILRVRLVTLLLMFGVALSLFFVFRTELLMKLEKNTEQSSTDFGAHIKSVSNITTDASNLERINRWHSALRMFKEKPFWGWGPGTYQFNYAPYQLSKEMTFISTNAGDRGNAHSEYIGPMAESGVLGAATFILIVILILYRGSQLYWRLKDKEMRLITLGVLLGLITYFIHGTLNNFLDTDKASVPFWGFVAILVALDIAYPKEEKNQLDNKPDNIKV